MNTTENTTSTGAATMTYEFAYLNPTARKHVERHLVTLGFGSKMTRKERGERREAARIVVALPAESIDNAELLEFAGLIGMEQAAIINPRPGVTILAPKVNTRDVAALAARSIGEVLA